MDTRENKQCPFFDTLPETIYHAFKECHYALVMERWHEVEIRLHEKINGNPKKSHTEKIYETNSKIKLIKIWQLSANETPPISQQRWSEELNIAEEINWPFSYMLPFKCRLNARIKYFQYQINHRSLITNKKLFQFELIDHEECDKCNEVETIQHLLVECDTLTNLWDNVHRWLRERVIRRLITDTVSIILGNEENKHLANYIIIVVKHEIYKGKWKDHIPTLIDIKRTLKNYMKIEIFIATMNDTVAKTMGKWSSIYNDLINI